jgi:capsular polysaccharide biosynthesis protein
MAEVYTSEAVIDAPYVCEVADATLVGPEALPIKDGRYVYENCLESDRRLANSYLRSLGSGTLPVEAKWLDTDQEIDAAVSLVGPWSANYTHWFQDYLTRLEGFDYYCSETNTSPSVLIPAGATDWMRDALRAAGYGPEQWIEWKGGRAKVNRLIVPSVRREANERTPNQRRNIYSPSGTRWVQDRILNNIKHEQTVPHSKRVFVSRSDATVRRVANEEEVMELLEDWGFRRYCTRELSFAEQVTLFSNAEAIVSPHGSGLMNQIFATNAVVIELMGKKQTVTSPATEYFNAELLGHNYGCVPGEAIGPDLRADVDALTTVLEKMLGE